MCFKKEWKREEEEEVEEEEEEEITRSLLICYSFTKDCLLTFILSISR